MAMFIHTKKWEGDSEHSDRSTLNHTFEMQEEEFIRHYFTEEILNINVAGKLFQTYKTTLEKFPKSLLGDPERRNRFRNPKTKELFFDRHRASFESILYYYQSGGVMARPPNIPADVFVNELIFFDLGDELIEKLQIDYGLKEIEVKHELPNFKPFRIVWEFLDYPQSSILAKAFAIASIFVIILSLVLFVIETVPDFKSKEIKLGNRTYIQPSVHETWMKYSNTAVNCWFTVEFLLRFISCPNKLKFFITSSNIIDFLSILPYYLSIILSNFHNKGTSILRVIRVLRVFKLVRHSRGLQILGNTLKASFNELMMLAFFLMVMILIFGSCVYYAEYEHEGTKFVTIPNAFWWAIVTMGTVGYGDMYPETLWGQLIGSVAVVCGVLTIALPVPVIVSNFEYFYSKEKSRQKSQQAKMEEEKRKEQNLKVYKRFLLAVNYPKIAKNMNFRKHSISRKPDGLELKLETSPPSNVSYFSNANPCISQEKQEKVLTVL